jgi:hypothetical protein
MSKMLFFQRIRESFGPLTPGQVEGINILLKATERLPIEHRAYILATAWLETGPEDSKLHMRPRREIGPKSYFNQYNAGTEKGQRLGNTLPGDGYLYRGRGYVQLTGRHNYQTASLATGRDLVIRPDDALDPVIAANIMVNGMRAGWFTGKKLSDYKRYMDMRRVVNGMDKAADIAGYAAWFEHALRALKEAPKHEQWLPDVPLEPPPGPLPPGPCPQGPAPPPIPEDLPPRAQTWWEWFKSFFN